MKNSKIARSLVSTLFVICLSTATHAAVYQTCQDKPNQVPCDGEAWDVGVEALYLRTTGDFFISTINSAVSIITNSSYTYYPAWGWGIRVEGGLHFGDGYDLSANWMNYAKTSNTSWGQGILNIPNAPNNSAAASTAFIRDTFNIVNIELGQGLVFGERFKARVHGGIQYANLTETINYDGITTGNVEPGARIKLDGWGPRVGLDGIYNLVDSLDFYAKGALGLIYMQRNYSTFNANYGIGPNARVILPVLVPENDVNIGLQYKSKMAQGDLKAKVSWVNIAYIGATPNDANYSWTGLSFGLNWLGNA